MLGEVVGAVKLPQPWDVVHQAVVDVEPKVNHDGVHAQLDEKPAQVNRAGKLVLLVCEYNGHDGPQRASHDKRRNHLTNADIGHAIAAVLVAVKVAIDVADSANDLDLANGGKVEPGAVEPERGYRAEVAPGVSGDGVVDDDGHDGIRHDPFVNEPLRCMRYFFRLCVHRNRLV